MSVDAINTVQKMVITTIIKLVEKYNHDEIDILFFLKDYFKKR